MKKFILSPVILLLVVGTLMGLNFPLGKIAGEAGISPMVWAMLVSLGASGMLLPILVIKKILAVPRGKVIIFVVTSALISFVIPNLLLFSVIPHAGAGFTGLMFALSPVFTLTMAAIARLKTPNLTGKIGIAIGLAGATIVSIARGAAPEAPAVIWMAAALFIPFALAVGNIYRTKAWPEKALPDVLAFWSHAFAVTVFLTLLIFTRGSVPWGELSYAPLATLAQVVVAGVTFPLFFRLQLKGGPVLLSQIGYVAAAVSLIAAVVVLGEQYGRMTWFGAAVIGVGVGVTVVSQATSTRQGKDDVF